MMDLTPFAVVGIVLILIVVGLWIWRKSVASNEDDTIHVLGDSGMVPEQEAMAKKLDVIDRWGKIFTVITVVYVVAIAGIFVYQQWMMSTNSVPKV
jgi:hypothetical protein